MTVQQIESVETSVRRALHNSLGIKGPFLNDRDYLKVDLDGILHDDSLKDDERIRQSVYYSFLRKWKGLDTGIDKDAVAFEAWLAAEQQCLRSNEALYDEMRSGNYSIPVRVITLAQLTIRQILGFIDFDHIASLCRFGNGATSDLKRGSSHVRKSWRPSITFDAIPAACRVISGDRYLGSLVGGLRDLAVVDSNRMVMVPKSAKTSRTIAAEPTLNGFIQQGVGRYIRGRLLRFGVDLNDQTVNQVLASRANEMDLATIDLASASDTLCTALVKLLLPNDWFELLDSLRCKKSRYHSRSYHLQKFSSMGNAFTFELESMIFYALVNALRGAFPLPLTHSVISVYGDDIILPSAYFRMAKSVLSWAGFRINDDKSFTGDNGYKESCGKHYLYGAEVTPTYQKDVCSTPHDLVRLHNRIVRLGIRLNLRNEVADSAAIVRRHISAFPLKLRPGVGPLVDYDEYLVREDFRWETDWQDRIRVRSAVTTTKVLLMKDRKSNYAYFARKLRCPAFLSSDPKGQTSEVSGSRLVVIDKYHWRSASSRLP